MHVLHFLRHFNTLETVFFGGHFMPYLPPIGLFLVFFPFLKFSVVLLLDLNEVTQNLSGSRD